MVDFTRYLSGQRLTKRLPSVTEKNPTVDPRESDMSSSSQRVPSSDQPGCSLERDESRFRYFSPNGKALIRADYPPFLSVKTSYELAHEANVA
jgi:hypothetical protein